MLLFVGPCWHSGRLTLRLSLVRPLRWGSRSCWPSWSLRSGGLGPEQSLIFILNNFWSFNLENGTWFPLSSFCGALHSLATAPGNAYKTPVKRLSTVCKVLNLEFTLNNWQNLNWQRGLLEALPPLIFLQQAIKFQEMIHIKTNQDQDGKICPKLYRSNFVSLCKKKKGAKYDIRSILTFRVPCSLPTRRRSWRNLFRWRDFVATLTVLTLGTRLMILDNVSLL